MSSTDTSAPHPSRQPSAGTALQPTDRSTVKRGKHRVVTDRAALHRILSEAFMGHLGLQTTSGEVAHPVVLPVAYGLDLAGPDREGTLYLHGSVASHWLRSALGTQVCFTVTELDALVLAQRSFNHSMNYRCAVVLGTARAVDDLAERERALDLIVDQSVPGRAATLPPSTRKELAATAVFAVSLYEASVKVRAGGPGDDVVDPDLWAGHVPLRRVAEAPVTADYGAGPVPDEVTARAEQLGACVSSAP